MKELQNIHIRPSSLSSDDFSAEIICIEFFEDNLLRWGDEADIKVASRHVQRSFGAGARL